MDADTITALKAISPAGLTTGVSCNVLGSSAANDGGGAIYRYDSTSSATGDDYWTVTPSTNPATGRWSRLRVATSLPFHFITDGFRQVLCANPMMLIGAAPPTHGPGALTYRRTGAILSFNPKDFNGWGKTNVSVTVDTTVAPDGTTTADTVTPTVAGGAITTTSSRDPAGKRYRFSVWLKAATAHNVTILIRNNDFTESFSKEVAVTTTWQEFYIDQRFTLTGKTFLVVAVFPGSGLDLTMLPVIAWNGVLKEFTDVTTYPTTLATGDILEAEASGIPPGDALLGTQLVSR